MRQLEMSHGGGMHINPGQKHIYNYQLLGSKAFITQAIWLQVHLQTKHNPVGTIQYKACLVIKSSV
jgi:hypothetical protein